MNSIQNVASHSRRAVRLLAVLLALVMVLPLLPSGPFTVQAASLLSDYTSISAAGTYPVTITRSGEKIGYAFTPEQSGVYSFASVGEAGDPYGTLLDASGIVIASNDNANGNNFSLSCSLMAGVTYYFHASMVGSRIGSYQLVIRLEMQTAASDYARSYSSTYGDVFLGGMYIELGLRGNGAFGTQASAPSGFHPKNNNSSSIGLRSNGNQPWSNGLATGKHSTSDFFLPGTIDEGWLIGWTYTAGGSAALKGKGNAFDSYSSTSTTGFTTQDTSNLAAGRLSATTVGTISSTVGMTQTISFGQADKYFMTTVTLTNNSAQTLYDLSYIRAFDPDQKANNTNRNEYDTDNYFYKDEDGNVWVMAFGWSSHTRATSQTRISYDEMITNDTALEAPFIFLVTPSEDYYAQAVNTTVGWSNYSSFYRGSNSYKKGDQLYGTHYYSDSGIGIEFIIDSLDAGESVTISWYSSLDTAIMDILTDFEEEVIHNYVTHPEKKPTCTESGWYEYTTCDHCGYSNYSYRAPLGHSYSSSVTREATCTTNGLLTYTCATCGDSYEVTTYAEHDYVLTVRPATCTVPGAMVYTCSTCEDVYETEIPAGHTYVAAVTKVATRYEDGQMTYTCEVCGDSYTEVIPASNATVLLIQDRLPWSGDNASKLLTHLVSKGYLAGWAATTTAQFHTVDLSQYNVIYVANDQTTATYRQLRDLNDALTAFAQAGGVVVYGACDNGWSGGEISHLLPGGVSKIENISRRNYILDATHLIVTGSLTDDKAITDALLNGTYCSHTSFDEDTLPAGYRVILQDGYGNPTLAEYPMGEGFVIVSGLTWEYYYSRIYEGSTSYSKNVFDDLLVYAASLAEKTICTHDYDAGVVISPSCTTEGYTLHTCSMCGAELKDTYVPALGHCLGSPIVDVNPGCTTPGSQHQSCSRCSETVSEVLPATGHSYGEWSITMIVTCTTPGEKERVCAVCSKPETKTVPATGDVAGATHIYDDGCDAECNGCHATREAPHTYESEWTCDATGHWHACADCTGKKDFAGHDYPDGEKSCKICGFLKNVPGDMNGDNRLTPEDAIYLLYAVRYGIADYPLANSGDVDGNGTVNEADATYLLYYIYFGAEYPLA